MLKTHYCKEVKSSMEGKKVLVGGWVHFSRVFGGLVFIKLRDSTGIVQVTASKKKVSKKIFDVLKKLTYESVILVEGVVKKSGQAERGFEIIPTNVEVLSRAATPLLLPISEKTDVLTGTLFQKRELAVRIPSVNKYFKIKAEIARSAREFFQNQSWTELFTPYIVATATEGGSEMFPTLYFDEEAYLAQSAQFYKQAAISAHEKVFGILPSWRAEKSRTTKHLTEFHQIEMECAFADENDVMKLLEKLIVHVVKSVKKNCAEELKFYGRELRVPKTPFKRMTFLQAKKELEKLGVKEKRDDDFSTPAETTLSKKFKDPFFITDYPTKLRGMYYGENKKGVSATFDLIAPEGFGELCTGGQRIYDYKELLKRIKSKGYDPKSFEWYLNLFKYGMPPHAGCGVGLERLAKWISGAKDIRDVVMFPRTPDILKP
ncbi:MAG: aspartate--tRNA(Asn) ligase [Nanoarchaeota archaeon]|nr:aspartate--tRNA(Asn) ligase [Nanoarchaeota archaeon]